VLFIEDNIRIHGRKDPKTWHSWSNLKMLNGIILEQPRYVEVSERAQGRHHLNDNSLNNMQLDKGNLMNHARTHHHTINGAPI
jgi:hypothetical protein